MTVQQIEAVDNISPLVQELRTLNVASGRVRGFEPASASATYEGDALGPGKYKRFVVLIDLGGPPVRNVIQRTRVAARCYGATPQDAKALWMDVQEALHLRGVRSTGQIYQTRDDTGGSATADPDTGQPYYDGVFVVTQGITPSVAGS